MRRLLPPPAVDDPDLAEAYAWPDGGCVRAMFVASLDGSATVDGRSAGLGGAPDKAAFDQLRRTCDAVLVGAGTARGEGYGKARSVVCVVSARLSLSPDDRLFQPTPAGARPLVLTCASAPADRRAALAPHAEVVDVGDDAVDLGAALAELHRRDLRRVMCEGGPSLLADLLAADLVDELCLTLAPTLVAGDGPRILSGPALRPPREAHLLGLLEADGVLLGRWSLSRR